MTWKQITGFQKNDEKVKVTFLKAEGDSGNSFDFNTPGSYQAFYRVDPLSGNPSYQIMRRIVVEARENSTQEPQGEVSQHTEDGSGEDGEADPDPEIPEVLTEEPEMPDAGAELIDLTPKEDKGMFLSVVPAAMEQQKGSNVHLVQGEKIPYPSNVGNYSTSYFTVNGHVAYCLESMKASPPTSDYVANEFESNPELQKVLYYGYGGPGDITGEYMPSFDWKTKYIFTHLAAAYSYCGMDGFYGCTFEDIKASGVWGYIQHIYSLEAPPTAAITLSPKEAKAYESGKEQRTGEFTLKGDHRNYITLKMPEHVTYHSGSTKQTGTVKINGNTTFYFSAPKTVTGTWNSGKLKGQMGTQWKTLVLSTGSGSQDIGYGAFFEEESASVEFTVKWLDLARVKVTKKDKNSKVNLSGAVFGIYSDSACKNLLVQMPATDSNGTSEVEIPKTQDTVYLKEISVPEGYKLNTESFNVKLETGKTTSVAVTNEEQKGKITIRKKGEVLTGVTGEEGNLTFVYGNADFAGAEYNIYAAEDIYSQDKVTKVHKAGDLVESLTTGEDGSAVSKELYLGKYDVVEVKAPIGFVLNATPSNVELVYAGQEVSVTDAATAFCNDRQKIEISALKAMEQDEAFGIGMNGEITAVSFGLYAKEEIIAADGSKIPADGLIEIAFCNAEGNVRFQSDVPFGRYYVTEVSTDPHYMLNGRIYSFEFVYAGQEVGTVTATLNEGKAIENELIRGTIKGLKVDGEEKGLAGATFGLFNEWEQEYTKENAYLTVVSDENGAFKFENVPFGDYVVVELEAPEGYMKSDARHFVSVTYDTQVIGIKAINYLIVGSVQLTKVDAEYPDNKLTGAVFEVFADTDKDGAFDAENDECLGTLTEINEGIYEMTGLLYGNYFVKEKAAPEGFLLDENVYTVSIVNDKEVVMVENEAGVGFMDQPVKGKVTIFKTDDESGEKLVGAGFRICDTEGNAVAEGYTGEEGTVSFELRYGKYTVAEFEAPKGYVLDEAPYSFEVTEHGQKISIDMANTKIKGKIVISKVDADTEELLPDAGFRIYDVNGEVIREGRTDKNGNVEFDLEFGTYYYQEFDAPEGYEVNDEKYEFTITEDGQVLSVIMTNKAIPKETPEEPDEPKKDTPTETPKTPTYTEGPKTGDDADVALWMVLAVLAAITGVGLTVFSVKRKKKDKEK